MNHPALSSARRARGAVLALALPAFGLTVPALAAPRGPSGKDAPLLAQAAAPLPQPATRAQPPVVEPVPGREAVSLQEALVRAARHNPELAAARAQAAIAEAGKRRAWSAWKPELKAQGSYVRTSAPARFDLGPLLNGVAQSFGLGPLDPATLPPPVDIVAQHSRYGTLELSQPLFSPQGLFLISPASKGAEAAALGAREAREQVLLGVARTYLGLQGISELLAAARDAEAVALRREQDARAQLNAGTAVEISLLRAQTETAQARAQIAQLEGQRESLLSLLEALVGSPVQPSVEQREAALPPPADEASQPWEQTFRVRAAAKAVEASRGLVRYDQFAWLPTVAAVARGNYNSNAGFTGENTSYDVLLAVNVPLYDRGLRYAAKEEDEAKLRQAQANLDSARAQAKAAWIAARAQRDAAQAVLTQAESQAQLATRAQKQVEAAYRAGVATNLELSDADIRRFLAASSQAQARAQLDIRRAELAAAQGQLQSLVGEPEG